MFIPLEAALAKDFKSRCLKVPLAKGFSEQWLPGQF